MGALANIFLGKSVASGQEGRGFETSSFDPSTGLPAIQKGDPLSKALTGFEVDMMETTPFDAKRSTAKDPFGFNYQDAGLKTSGGSKELTPTQVVGLQALSTGLEVASELENIRQDEKMAMDKIAAEYRGLEFSERLQSSMAKISEARSLLQSIDNLNRQVRPQTGTSQTQQFFTSPTTGMRLT